MLPLLLHILLADDDPEDIELFEEALREISTDAILTTTSNGARILAMLRQVTPDIIFLDINMPGMNGLDCLRGIREIPSLRKVPVVIYSTAASEAGILEAFTLGANRYIKKPASLAAIKDCLEEVLTVPAAELLQARYPGNFYRATV